MANKDSRDELKHPIQPVGWDCDGRIRFKHNAIVRFLLDMGPFDLNQIALLPNISREDHEQFAQLIGYSLSGFGELPYVSNEVYAEADLMAHELRQKER